MLKLTQVRGGTWVIEADELIPLYKVDDAHCILLDTGLESERSALVETLDGNGLVPIGVFGSHAHRDHGANNFFLREKYGARVSLPEGEAALCLSAAMYRGAYDTFTPQSLVREYGCMLGRTDETVGPMEQKKTFCGIPFGVLHTPGHTPDHICIATPDDVLYVADALMAAGPLEGAKIPYHYTHAEARKSMETLRGLHYGAYIMAHRAVREQIDTLVDENLQMLDKRCGELLSVLRGAMTLDELLLAFFQRQKTLTSKEEKAARYIRNARTLLEYLVDLGAVIITVREGMIYYQTSN